MTTDLDPETDLVLERRLKAPRAAVWRCWTEPAQLKHWFVPKPNTVTACALDVRPGGVCNTTFDVGGTVMENQGVYLEVVEGEKLVFTDGYTEGWKPAPEPFMTAIILLADAGSECTDYTAIARHRTKEAAQHHRDMGFFEGWGVVADQLEAHARDIEARTMTIERVIGARADTLWRTWINPAVLPVWWGPQGFSCRTARIDLREGGDWVFDMIAPDGTVFPNHHRYTRLIPGRRIDYSLHRGENGPLHADASAVFEDRGDSTRITLRMTFATAEEREQAQAMGAPELGQQTLAKLARQVGAT